MSEFEWATLAFLLLVLGGVGGYSYWQVYRAQKAHNAHKAQKREAQEKAQAAANSRRQMPSAQALGDSSDEHAVMQRSYAEIRQALQQAVPSEPSVSLQTNSAVATNDQPPMLEQTTDVSVVPPVVISENVPLEAYRGFIESDDVVDGEFTQLDAGHVNPPLPTSFDWSVEEERLAIERRVTLHELNQRATWAVFTPYFRFESWLETAYPQGAQPVVGIDAHVIMSVSQPKTAADVERALSGLRLDTSLHIRMSGERAGAMSQANARLWEDLQAGAPYRYFKLTLQLANRNTAASKELLEQWLILAERFCKRIAGSFEFVPQTAPLAYYARFLHDLARRLVTPVVVQLHKKNGLWSAIEVHQHLAACGAQLNPHGVYVVNKETDSGNTHTYSIINDLNNPRAPDFVREYMPTMYVHTLSFCMEVAQVDMPINAIQIMLQDIKHIADGLGAQWQNGVGEVILFGELMHIAPKQTHTFVQQLAQLGLQAGEPQIKRLVSA